MCPRTLHEILNAIEYTQYFLVLKNVQKEILTMQIVRTTILNDDFSKETGQMKQLIIQENIKSFREKHHNIFQKKRG